MLRFYLGKVGTGVTILVRSILGVFATMFGICLLFLAIACIWLIVDLVLIPGIVTRQRDSLWLQISNQIGLLERA